MSFDTKATGPISLRGQVAQAIEREFGVIDRAPHRGPARVVVRQGPGAAVTVRLVEGRAPELLKIRLGRGGSTGAAATRSALEFSQGGATGPKHALVTQQASLTGTHAERRGTIASMFPGLPEASARR